MKKYIEAIRLNKHIEIIDAEINNIDVGEIDVTQFPKSMEIYFNYAMLEGKEVFYLSNILDRHMLENLLVDFHI